MANPSCPGNRVSSNQAASITSSRVVDASASTWTSHRAYVGLEPAPRWLHVQEGLALAGFSDAAAFDRWVADPLRRDFDVKHDLEVHAPSASSDAPRVAPDLTWIIALTADELGIAVTQLCSRQRTFREVVGREAVVHIAALEGLTGVETARALGLTQQAVSLMRARGICDQARALAARVLQRAGVNATFANGVRHETCTTCV